MGYVSLSDCLADLEAHGHLRRIDVQLDPRLELAAAQRMAFRAGSPALLFTRPKNCRFPMLANLFGTKERARFIFRDGLRNLENIFRAKINPAWLIKKPLAALSLAPALARAFMGTPRLKRACPLLANTCALRDLPQLVSWPGDGGPFITLPLVYSEDPDMPGAANLGMYRVQIAGNSYQENEAGMHYQLQRGIGIHHAKALARGMELPVHVYVGGPPSLSMAAVMPLPEGMNEIMFAALLGNGRIHREKPAGFALPVISECDFLLRGKLAAGVKPEGPFGDHLGYYSLQHDFPVLKIERVYHRDNAIWPFTSVGRPPQEDTIFGDFIHELTAPLVSHVFEGVREVHAVDAAGVHPLLLAVGQERYTAWEARRKPRELLTLAMHLLGATQTALAKYLLIAASEDAPGLSCRHVPAFLRHMLERADFRNDLHFLTNVNCDTLDYSGTALNEGSKLIWASAGEKRRELAAEIRELPDLPPGFGNPAIIAAGILAMKGPANSQARGIPDPAVENLGQCLSAWSCRENFPLIVIADDPEFCAESFENFLWVTFTRSDPAADCYGAFANVTAKRWSCQAPLLIDARKKPFHAPPLEEDQDVIKRLENLAVRNGPLAGIF